MGGLHGAGADFLGGSTMEISEAIDRGVKARWRHDLISILTDAGRTLAGTGLRDNGSVYRDINIGMLLLEAARSLQECQDEAEPEKAAPKPMTNGDRIQDRKDGELTERERLERLFEEARQITDRRAWDGTSRTMADSCGQEANDE